MRAQPAASHWIAGAPFEDAAGAPLECATPPPASRSPGCTRRRPAVLDRALRPPREGFAAWSATPPPQRARVLRRAADLIRARNRELAELETLDTGKPISETLVADWPSGADALEWFAGLAASLSGEAIDLGGDFVYTRREPLGVCLGIGAWNYPSQIACWKAAPALACGNALIFKPSELTPLGALKLGEILAEAGLPAGAFSVVQGGGAVGAALAGDPGDRQNLADRLGADRRKVYAAAAAGLKPVTLELGGKSPLIVFADADLDSAVGGAMLGNFYSAGQVCSNATRVFVERGVEAEFLDRLVAAHRAHHPRRPDGRGRPDGPADLERPGRQGHGLHREGAPRARACSPAASAPASGFEGGFFVQPTVFAGVEDGMAIAREEIFGPVMSVLAFDGEEEAIARANATPYGLAAGVFTRDLARAHRVIARLDAGTTWINAYNLTPIEAPFGGVKASGLGRENGRAAIEHWTRVKSVYVATGPVEAPF